jgi:8-oxo-dGTP diphosphatase
MTNESEAQDKLRTVITPQDKVNFVLLPPSFVPPFEKVTTASVVPFTRDARIVAVKEKRGYDIPGGHVQVGEKNFEDTARRETLEEIGATLEELKLVRIIQSDYYGNEPEKFTYLMVFTAFIKSLNDDPAVVAKRSILDKIEFLSLYGPAFKKQMETLVFESYAICFPDHE